MLGVKAAVKDAERVRRELVKLDAFNSGLKIRREKNFVVLPVKIEKIKELQKFKTLEVDFEAQETRKKFSDYLGEFLSPGEIQLVRTSFDIVGDIVIIEIPEELEKHERRLAESLMLAHRSIKTVFKKGSEIRGEERVRELKFLAGENKTETLYKEHGCRFKVDVSKVYFSPRLSYERQRILEQVKDGEVIVDLFAGVGPFSILLAKYRDVKAYAIDINPVAFGYLKENIRLNKVEDRVMPLLGDAREAAPRNAASRVIMNLPKSADRYLDLAFDILKEGVVHFYAISPEQDLYDSKAEFIKKIAKEKNRKATILNKRIVRPYSPRNYHIVMDVGVA